MEGEKDLWLVRHYSMEGPCFRTELEKWRLFRDYQRMVRLNISTFVKTQHDIDIYRERDSISYDLKPQLHIDLQKQTKVDDWKEFWFHQFQMRAENWAKCGRRAAKLIQYSKLDRPKHQGIKLDLLETDGLV